MSKDTKEEVVEQEVKPEFTLCPHCGLDYTVWDAEVTPEDKEAWVRHVLGEEYFTKTFTMMSGRLEVTLRSRKDYENRDISLALSNFLDDLKSIMNSGGMQVEASKYNLAISLHEIVVYDADGTPSLSKYDALEKSEFLNAWESDSPSVAKRLYEERISDMGPGKISALTTALLQFDQLQLQLARHSNDPDFW